MGAACVTQSQKDQDEIAKINMDPSHNNNNNNMEQSIANKDELLPTSPVQLLFEVMSHDIGYNASALQSYCDKLQSLWIYRVIDVLSILEDDITWNKLEIPSVLEHVIRDYLNKLLLTKTFKNYQQQSHTDIYVTFINKDIRTLFKQLLKQVNNLQIAQQHINYLQNYLGKKYLFNIDKLKKYLTKQEWDELNVPQNLKNIICRKINLDFDGEYDNNDSRNVAKAARAKSPSIDAVPDDSDDDESKNELEQHDEGGEADIHTMDEKHKDDDDMEIVLETPRDESIVSGIHNMSRRISKKLQSIKNPLKNNNDIEDNKNDQDDDDMINSNLHIFDEKITKEVNVRFNMMDLAKYFSKELFIDDIEKLYQHFSYFVEYGYHNLYHLGFISDEIFNKLLMITNTPKCLIFELYELLTIIRSKYNDSMNNINNILPFQSNLYWEKLTVDAFKILEKDINLSLINECNILMNNFYSNIWDWQFITNEILLQLNAYQRYEIVRIRMQHIIKLCQYQYGQQNIPLLPPIWNSQYNANLLIHRILPQTDDEKQIKQNQQQTYTNYHQFRFDGLDFNENTKSKIKILVQYLDKNFVRKIQFLPIQHRNKKNEKEWTKLFENNNISKHLRFKINFYSIQGLPNSDDIWINNYIQKNYKKILPQFNQSMDIDIITAKSKAIYNDIESKVFCIENMLHFINVFNKINENGKNNGYRHTNNKYKLAEASSNSEIVEMKSMIQSTIKEIDEMGLNEQFYQIIQFCGTKRLNELKENKFKLLMNKDIDLTQFDELKCNELNEIHLILLEMKDEIYSIPIEDIIHLSQTVCGSVQWLSNELNKYDINY